MKPPKVGLVGFYGHGNFGDDLMAVIFGLFLKSLGVQFSVYRLCAPYARRFGFHVAQSAEELLDGTDVLLWGGGGLLVPWPDLLYRALFPRAAQDYQHLVGLALRKGVRLIAASVGGDGTAPPLLTPRYKQMFAGSAHPITVRNPQDLPLLDRLGVKGECFPDIIWQTGERFPVQPRKTGRIRIGLDIYAGNLLRRNAAYLIPLLYAITRKRRDCEFILIDTTNRARKPYRGLGLVLRGPNIVPYQFEELEQDLEFLASLDLLVSTRLHTPPVCMQYGVPAVSLFGEGKTQLLFQNLGLARQQYSHRRIGGFLSMMLLRDGLDPSKSSFSFPDVPTLRRESAGHLRALQQALLGTPTK
jgi:polysaccharide pyruvyl transferase WcaK-like protein